MNANTINIDKTAIPNKVGKNLELKDKQKLAKATKDFESMLTSMLLKSMMSNTKSIWGDDSFGGDNFEPIFQMQLADKISSSKGLGIAEKIYRNVTGEEFDKTLLMKNKIRPTQGIQKSTGSNSEKTKISPSSESLNRLMKYQNVIAQAAKQFGVSDSLIKSVILTESAAKENAVSKVKAKGLMQLMDATANDMGVADSFNPVDNIFGGTKYLSAMLDEFDNDVDLALAAYNAGPGNVKKYDGIPPFDETQNYVKRIRAYLNYFED